MLDREVHRQAVTLGKGADHPWDLGYAAITGRTCCNVSGGNDISTANRGPRGAVRALLSSADVALVNHEGPAPDTATYHPSGFTFTFDPSLLPGLRDAGIDIVSLANNHIRNAGSEGVLQTMRNLRRAGIRHVGAGRDDRSARSAACRDVAAEALVGSPGPVLVDCLTLWLTNLILAEHEIEAATVALESALDARRAPTFLVANEVGLGIVPEHALGRLFRDAAGRLNQRLAARAERVLFMVAGLPIHREGDPMSEAERHRDKMAKRKAVQDAEVAGKTLEKGLLIVHTGPGKGKSTAAWGLLLRMLGYERRCARGAVHQGRLGDRRAPRAGALRRPRRVPRAGRGLHLGDAGQARATWRPASVPGRRPRS